LGELVAQKAGQQEWGQVATLEAEQQQPEPEWAGAFEGERQDRAQAPEGERQPHQEEGADPEWGWGGFWR
jgi:hypothetical protein